MVAAFCIASCAMQKWATVNGKKEEKIKIKIIIFRVRWGLCDLLIDDNKATSQWLG